MKARKFAGLGLLIAVALIIGGIRFNGNGDDTPPSGPGSDITVTGITTVGKIAFLNDADVNRILKDKYGITVTVEKEIPSNAMVDECVDRSDELDFCWTSSETAGEQMKQRSAPGPAGSAVIFNSPIVLYTWAPIADALIAQGIVEKTGDTYYVADFSKLIEITCNGTRWSDIGLAQLYGSVKIYSTDPASSNSGNSFAGLLANMFNGGEVVDESTVNGVIPQVRNIFNCMGLLKDTTLPLFEDFLNLGIGSAPIIVAYESYLIAFSLEHQSAASQEYIRDNVRTLYPKPTVWTTQPLVAFSEEGERFMNALRDPEIQGIGWKLYGFRPGRAIEPIDLSVVNLPGVPETFDSIIHMPKPEVMDQLIQGIQATPTDAIKPETVNENI
jgi:hypothetical protein